MTLTLKPETEARLLAWAEYVGGDDVVAIADKLLADELTRVQAEECAAFRVALKDSDTMRFRPFSEFVAEMRAKYNLPTHLSDECLFADEEGIGGLNV